MNSAPRLIIPRPLMEGMRNQALGEMPNEACGYLAGTISGGILTAAERIPMSNMDASPEHFSFDPKEQFAAVKQARKAGLRLISVYHSHPETPARMSDEDIRCANDSDTVYLIYSVVADDVKGFTVNRNKDVREFKVETDV